MSAAVALQAALAAQPFVEGALVGLVVTAPPGPVGGLCIRRTLRDGLAAGLVTAVGGLVADASVGIVAATGVNLFGSPSGTVRSLLAVAAGLALVVLGVRHLRRVGDGEAPDAATSSSSRTSGGEEPNRPSALAWMFAGTFALTLGTPGTLPAFVFLFSCMDLAARTAQCAGGVAVVVAGVIAGAAAWWFALCYGVHRLRASSRRWLRAIDYACGVLLLVGAAGALWSGLTG